MCEQVKAIDIHARGASINEKAPKDIVEEVIALGNQGRRYIDLKSSK